MVRSRVVLKRRNQIRHGVMSFPLFCREFRNDQLRIERETPGESLRI